MRDNPPATARTTSWTSVWANDPSTTLERTEVHDVLRRWRALAARYDPPRVLMGETYVFDLDQLASFYGHDDELQLAFNFPFLLGEFDAVTLRGVVERTEAALPADVTPIWTMGNHDVSRFPTRWCGDDPRCARATVLVMLLGLRGTPGPLLRRRARDA